MTITLDSTQSTKIRYEFLDFLEDRIHEFNPNPKLYNIGTTGFDRMGSDSSRGTAAQIEKIDIVTMPFAFALLAFMVRSWRLLLISMFNVGLSILTAFAVMATVVHLGAPHPENASSQLVEVMCMALSIDYSLFLLRRFRDEVKLGADVREATFMSLLHAGHVVVMSGSTIVVVFIGFMFLPAKTIVMDGAGCSVGVSLAMIVALTNTPAMLLAFPAFFSDFDMRPGCCRRGATRQGAGGANVEGGFGGGAAHAGENNSSVQVHHPHNAYLYRGMNNSDASLPVHPMYTGIRYRFTRLITKWPYNAGIIVLLYIIVLPLAVQIMNLNVNQDVLVGMPRHSASATRFRALEHHFPAGTFSPFYILIADPDPASRGTALSPAFFRAAKKVAERVVQVGARYDKDFTPAAVVAPVYAAGQETTAAEARALLGLAGSAVCSGKSPSKTLCSAAKQYEFLWGQNVNVDQGSNAMLVTITVPWFPFASRSTDFIKSIRDALDELQGEGGDANGFELYLCGFEVAFDALMQHVFGLFPVLVSSTMISVFVVLGVMLRSAFVPVRLALTMVLPLAAVFGTGVIVYQNGALNWLGAEPLKEKGGFFWCVAQPNSLSAICCRGKAAPLTTLRLAPRCKLSHRYVPILICSMLLGLALDYDVFLLQRVMEHRAGGYEIRASIVKAVCETGGTISAAGVIMAICFGGMLIGDSGVVNECGFLLCLGVLLDTFVVNTMLVPSLLSFWDHVAWWPTRMPKEDLKDLTALEFPRATDE